MPLLDIMVPYVMILAYFIHSILSGSILDNILSKLLIYSNLLFFYIFEVTI